MTIAKKRFGQNFLRDQNVLRKIITVVNPKLSEKIVEIGPGLGALTKHLLPLVTELNVIEIDKELIEDLLQECQGLGTLNLYQADALQFDFGQLASKGHSLRIVGNLPYNIATPLIFYLLTYISLICDMHFMLQKEVAERICAAFNSKNYGRLAVMVQYFCEPKMLFAVSPNAFYPKPKVQSAFLRLIPRDNIAVIAKDVNKLEQIVKLAFSKRRKTIHNCLKGVITDQQLTTLNIDPNSRAEQLLVDDFVRISNLLVHQQFPL